MIGDVMYVHTPFPNIVYALDLNNDGRILWRYEPQQDPNVIAVMCCDTMTGASRTATARSFSARPTTFVALDAKTGKVAWSVLNGRVANGSVANWYLSARGDQG